ncbi:MAG: alpha-mannosidase [Candidatus Hydrogenedentes bacterium]|jgi:alpha-mannosidase|nr:alpha-mannosidase [Candidatus Hydrogenedentota bacterium]
MEKVTLHMIGHGHIDPTWLWNWQEGFEEVRATARSVLNLMEEHDSFCFVCGSGCFYQWLKDSEPELFEKIKKRVEEGRWEIAGGFWVEPDCNIPCGESFVRQGLYSQRFFLREFGRICKVGFNPDAFGHAGTLPQILTKLRMTHYAYMRPEPYREMMYPGGTLFWWQAADGSQLLTSQIPLGYDAPAHEIVEKMKLLPGLSSLMPGQQHVLCFYGVGNHGGGPTRENLEHIDTYEQNNPQAKGKVQYSTLSKFFAAIEESTNKDAIPTLERELQHHGRGCYTAHSDIKRLNRQVEHTLMTAERFATIAWLLGFDAYPHDAFEKCWKDLLYNQFHDILAGTSLESTYEDSRDQLGAARHRADVILNAAIQKIAKNVDTSAGGNSIIAFNPLPWPVTAPLTAPPSVERFLEKPVHFVDDVETVVLSQPIRGERIGHKQYRFLAELPAMGYRVFHVRDGAKMARKALPLEAGPCCLQNMWWRIEFNPCTGEIVRLVDNTHKLEVGTGGNVLAAMVDHSDTWSHGVDEYRVEAGRFTVTDMRIVEQGDVQVTMRIVSRYGQSEVITEYTLYRDDNRIDCDLRINWQERYQMLKLMFNTNIQEGLATYDVPYGYQIRMPNGQEEPGQQWIDLTGSIDGIPYGLAILNDCKYGFDVLDGMIRVSLLRSPAYAHHDNGRFESNACWPIMDQGWQRVKLSLMPHIGDWRDAGVVKAAWELNAPPIVHPESSHPGDRTLQAGLLGTESDNVLLSVIKCSEDGDDIIIRGYETAGRSAETRLHLPYFDKCFKLVFSPHEIKTVRINRNTWTLKEVDLLEE